MKKIPYARVVCDGNELAYIQQVLESGWLTTASFAHEFEKRFATAVGAPYACAVNSCTAALHLAMEALGIGPGDEVLVPTMTFTASAEVVRYLGATPVLLDVEPGTCLLSRDQIAAGLDSHPAAKAVIVVHYAGQAACMLGSDGILAECRRRGVRVIEDAAHAFPARDQGRMVGSLGDVTCFSFYANKTITSGEGGMLTTANDDIWRRVKLMRLHGIDRDVWDRFTSEKPMWEYDILAPGFKYNMPDLNAAVGLAQLERANAYRASRQRCADYYRKHLAGIPAIELPSLRVRPEDHAWHLFPVRLTDNSAVSRDHAISMLAQRGIGTSVHYKPLHRMTYYRNTWDLTSDKYPNAENYWKGCLSLPIYPSLADDDLAYVTENLIGIVTK